MEKLNQGLTLVANLGVIAGFLLLAYELNQNSEATLFAAAQANRSERIAYFALMQESAYMPAIFAKRRKGEELSPQERYREIQYHAMRWALHYSEWVQRDIGAAGEYTTNEISIPLTLASDSAVRWWDAFGSRIYPERFVSYVEEIRRESKN